MPTTTAESDDFLARRARYAMLATLRRDGSPTTVPVWYEWNGQVVSMFCGATSSKLTRIQHDPRVTVLVSNDVDEPEDWVAYDGIALIEETGGLQLAERLAPLYWDLDDPERAASLKDWQNAGEDAFRLIVVEPTTIRTHT